MDDDIEAALKMEAEGIKQEEEIKDMDDEDLDKLIIDDGELLDGPILIPDEPKAEQKKEEEVTDEPQAIPRSKEEEEFEKKYGENVEPVPQPNEDTAGKPDEEGKENNAVDYKKLIEDRDKAMRDKE